MNLHTYKVPFFFFLKARWHFTSIWTEKGQPWATEVKTRYIPIWLNFQPMGTCTLAVTYIVTVYTPKHKTQKNRLTSHF